MGPKMTQNTPKNDPILDPILDPFLTPKTTPVQYPLDGTWFIRGFGTALCIGTQGRFRGSKNGPQNDTLK